MGLRVGKTVCVDSRSSIIRATVASTHHKSTPILAINGRPSEHTNSVPKPNLAHLSQTHARDFHTVYTQMEIHIKARCEVYPRTQDVKRYTVPDNKVPWSVDFPEYSPVDFTSAGVLKQPEWADLPVPSGVDFNTIDPSCNVDRNSYTGKYDVVNGFPMNPMGRTGCAGRGCLGRWGPNHAADPIVTRWKRGRNNEQVFGDDGKPILQFVSVRRRDNNEWALPGGMVNPGENRTVTLIREFGEEALNSLEASDDEKEHINYVMKSFFKDGRTIYKGYVDDPRNTDNSWMETKAINFHDEDGSGVGAFKLNAGDDAADVQWMDIDKSLELYASHIYFIYTTVEKLKAHW